MTDVGSGGVGGDNTRMASVIHTPVGGTVGMPRTGRGYDYSASTAGSVAVALEDREEDFRVGMCGFSGGSPMRRRIDRRLEEVDVAGGGAAAATAVIDVDAEVGSQVGGEGADDTSTANAPLEPETPPITKSSYHSRKARVPMPSLSSHWSPGTEITFSSGPALRSGRTPGRVVKKNTSEAAAASMRHSRYNIAASSAEGEVVAPALGVDSSVSSVASSSVGEDNDNDVAVP